MNSFIFNFKPLLELLSLLRWKHLLGLTICLGSAFLYLCVDHFSFYRILITQCCILIASFFIHQQILKAVLLTHFYCLSFFVAAESFIRFQRFGQQGFDFKNIHPASLFNHLVNFEADPSTRTSLKPNQEVYYKGALFKVNELGFRGSLPKRQKQNHEFRIVILGESRSMGAGVPEGQVFSDLLEKNLQKYFKDTDIQVLNFSFAAFTFENLLQVYQNQIEAYQPDLVLMDSARIYSWTIPSKRRSSFRSLQPKPPPYQENFSNPDYKFFSQRFFICTFLDQRRRLFHIHGLPALWGGQKNRSPGNRFKVREKTTSLFNEELERFVQVTHETPVALYSLRPIAHLALGEQYHKDRQDMMKKITSSKNIPYFSTYHLNLGKDARKYILYPGEHHPNALAHQKYGNELSQQLLPFLKKLIHPKMSTYEHH